MKKKSNPKDEKALAREKEKKRNLALNIRRETKEVESLKKDLAIFKKSLELLEAVNEDLSRQDNSSTPKKQVTSRAYIMYPNILPPLSNNKPFFEQEGTVEVVPAPASSSSTGLSNVVYLSVSVDASTIDEYGSKMAHMLVYLQELCASEDNRVIIFSQWNRMLETIGTSLLCPL